MTQHNRLLALRLSTGSPPAVRQWLPALGLVAAAIVLGMLAGRGSYSLIAVALALLLCPLLLIVPPSMMTQGVLWTTFVIQGSLLYYASLGAANWLPYLLCAFLALPVVGCLLNDREAKQRLNEVLFFPPFLCVLLYLFCLMLSTLINRPSTPLLIAGLKSTVPIWLFTPFLVAFAQQTALRDRLWQTMTLILFLQLPFVIHQHFVIAPMRTDFAPWDAVVGTFGGQMFAGGANATLVAFAIWVMTYHTVCHARGLVSNRWLAAVLLTGLAVIFLGEVKAAFFWLPALLGIALRRTIFRSVTALLSAIAICAALFVALWMVYEVLYWQGDTRGKDVSSRLDTMLYFVDDKAIDNKTGEISRGASISLWWKDNRVDSSERMVGFGTAASRLSGTVGVGKVAQRYYPLDIAATSASLLLWDAGLLGFGFFAAAIVLCGLFCWRHQDRPGLPPIESARLETLAITTVMFVTLLIYNRGLVDEPSTQLLLALFIGYAGHWYARRHQPAGEKPA